MPEDRALRLDEHERNTAGTVAFAEDERWQLRNDGSVFWSTDRFMGTVADELRNPLAPLKNAIEPMGASPDVRAR